MVNIGLFGYGRMGKEIERLAEGYGCRIAWIYDPTQAGKSDLPGEIELSETDVALDFSIPASAVENIRFAMKWNVNIVVGTTGWYDKFEEMKVELESSGIGFIYAQNFSIGVNVYLSIVKHAAAIMNTIADYDVSVHERHHRRKVDAPSGTAYKISEILLQEIERKKTLVVENPNKIPVDSELYISSERIGNVPGTHSVFFDGTADSIELTHTARSREGLAIGALRAAEWIKDKSGIYTMEDMIHEFIKV